MRCEAQFKYGFVRDNQNAMLAAAADPNDHLETQPNINYSSIGRWSWEMIES